MNTFHQLACFFCQGRSALFTEREVVQRMAHWTNNASPRTSTFRTERIIAGESGATETADIALDVSMARLTEIGIRIEFGSTIRTCDLADWITTRCTIGGLRVVDGSTVGTLDANGALHLHLLLTTRLDFSCTSHLLALSLQHRITIIFRVKCNIFVHHNLAFYHNLGAKI